RGPIGGASAGRAGPGGGPPEVGGGAAGGGGGRPPGSHYVERALERELYERRGISRAGAQPAVTLLADVVAFDDVVAPTREAYVAIFVTLVAHDQRQLLAREFTARSPITDADPASVARAMGVALDDCVGEIVSAVEAVLSHTR